MSTPFLTIALVAGETSGDILGANLIRALKEKYPNIRFVGIAGPCMQAEGCENWYDAEELAVMDIIEVMKRLRRLLKIRRDLISRLTKMKPDVFIGIDAPDFNINLENHLKKKGIKTIHYVSPSIWAWRKNRIFKIGRATNMVLVLLPYEKTFYDHYGIPCRFVGHIMADNIPLRPDKVEARLKLGISEKTLCLALLPGSRQEEVKMLSADFLKAALLLHKKKPNLEIIVPLINKARHEQFKKIKNEVAPDLRIRLLNGGGCQAMVASDIALLASGTATLECMLAKCPMVVGYRMKSFTFWLAKHLIKSDYFSLPNLLAGRELVPEFFQDKCQPDRIAETLELLLEDNIARSNLIEVFTKLHYQIRLNANELASQIVLDLACS